MDGRPESPADRVVVWWRRVVGDERAAAGELLRRLPVVALARRWFTAAEADWVAAQPVHRRTRCFLTLWTGKEAMGKAIGDGLRGGGLRRPMPVVPPPRFTANGEVFV